MNLFKKGLFFIISYDDKLVIPHLDVSKCNIKLFNNNTINEWKQFIHTFGSNFTDIVKIIKEKKYQFVIKNNMSVKIPYGYKTCIWETYPDLYNCNGEQVLLFLEKTRSCLSNIYIRTSAYQYLVEHDICPDTFINLNISDYKKLVEILIENGEKSVVVWCSIVCWWNYRSESIKNNEDICINILNNYCCPKLFSRCNWFLLLHSQAKINDSTKILSWVSENKHKVLWDEDLLSDTPKHAFNECYRYYNNIEIFNNEIKKRNIDEE